MTTEELLEKTFFNNSYYAVVGDFFEYYSNKKKDKIPWSKFCKFNTSLDSVVKSLEGYEFTGFLGASKIPKFQITKI